MIFLYYLPGAVAEQMTPEEIRRRGLGGVFRDCLGQDFSDLVSVRSCQRGPDGSSGAVVAALPVDATEFAQSVGYFPAKQTWMKVEGTSPYYFGADNEQPPTLEGLSRSIVVDGYDYELGDGRVWTCPTLRQPAGESLLPSVWGVDAAGNFQTRVLADYADDWKMAGEIWDVFFGVREIETSEAYDFCQRLLSINYRVGRHEVAWLNLLTSTNYHRVFKSAVDGERLETFLSSPEGQSSLREIEQSAFDPEKKTEEIIETSNSSAGQPEKTVITDRAAASCA